MKNWLTSSMASIPNSCRAVFGKSRWSSFLPKRALLNDHSAREILKRGFFEEFKDEQPGNASAPAAKVAQAVAPRNSRRVQEEDAGLMLKPAARVRPAAFVGST